MKRKVERYIKERNRTNCEYLTINRNEIRYHYTTRNGGIVGIVDLIEFTQLKKINCEYNEITSLINICDSVEYINCNENCITGFNCLPNDLKTLICSDNKITSLNNLPDNLKTLICDKNQISSLNNLPPGLKFLSCDSNKLLELNNLPLGLEYLSCGSNPIANLDYLPSGLAKLYLFSPMFELKTLNNLPNSIEEIRLCGDYLKELVSKQNLPKGLVLESSYLGLWKKIKTK